MLNASITNDSTTSTYPGRTHNVRLSGAEALRRRNVKCNDVGGPTLPQKAKRQRMERQNDMESPSPTMRTTSR